jgi:molecular chaperone Hsp33
MTFPEGTDSSIRFLFDDADIRGETVLLGPSLGRVLDAHNYSLCVQQLLGLFAAAAVLISNNLKYNGKIVLQARSHGPLSLVMIECTSIGEIRGIARGNIEADTSTPMALIEGGQLVITIEREGGQRYQGIVPLDGATLGGALDNYFQQSEQLQTRFWLACDGQVAAGFMLQQLPAQCQQNPETRVEQWQNATVLAATLADSELLTLPRADLLHRLFHESALRLFEPRPVRFNCSCSRERSLNALRCLDTSELQEIIAEEGHISMTCDMCNIAYQFNPQEVLGLAEPPVLH